MNRPRQRDRLLALLKSCALDWLPLSEILAAAGAQYGARILELRRLGHRIESKPGGGWFRLVTTATPVAIAESQAIPKLPIDPESLFDLTASRVANPTTFPEFGSLVPERHRDDG